MFPYDLATAHQANEVVGRYTLSEALDVLLEGTILSGNLSDKRVISISQISAADYPQEDDDSDTISQPL